MSRVSGAVELVRLMVLQGELRPGERIVEVLVAERLGVSRTVLREALRRLEGEGLLEADDGGGMHVIRLDERGLAETRQVRAALEALTAGLAAARVREGGATPAALDELGVLARAAAASRAPVLADRHFHRAVTALGANALCRDALNHVWDRIVLAAAQGVLGSAPAGADRDHHDLLAAIATGDEPESAAIAHRHALAASR